MRLHFLLKINRKTNVTSANLGWSFFHVCFVYFQKSKNRLIMEQCWTLGAFFTFSRSRMFSPDKLYPLTVGHSQSRKIKKCKMCHQSLSIWFNIRWYQCYEKHISASIFEKKLRKLQIRPLAVVMASNFGRCSHSRMS